MLIVTSAPHDGTPVTFNHSELMARMHSNAESTGTEPKG